MSQCVFPLNLSDKLYSSKHIDYTENIFYFVLKLRVCVWIYSITIINDTFVVLIFYLSGLLSFYASYFYAFYTFKNTFLYIYLYLNKTKLLPQLHCLTAMLLVTLPFMILHTKHLIRLWKNMHYNIFIFLQWVLSIIL